MKVSNSGEEEVCNNKRPHCSIRFFILSSIVTLFWGLNVCAASNMTPIAMTGWNVDVVIEQTAAGPPFTNYASEVNAKEGNAYYQTGLPTYAWGLPPSGEFVSLIGDNTLFQFQPYTGKNALILSPDTGLKNGTLTLVTPAVYGKLAILANSASGTNQTGTVTLNFTDGTSNTTTLYAPDWINGTVNVAWFGPGRINVNTGVDSTGPENPCFYQTTINLASLPGAAGKTLASITFGKANALSTAIYAVSGSLAGNSPAVGTPIAATGWNRDLVIENTAQGPPYGKYAAELNPLENKAFYETGLPGTSNGLPASGGFASAVDGASFQLQPYTASNALDLSSDTGINRGTLTLVAPTICNSLSLLADSAGGGGSPNLTINFSDGTTLTTNFNALDWFNNTLNVALSGFDRINLTNGATEGAPANPRFYQTTYNLAAIFGATNKPISSITFNQAASAGATAIYALSGVQVSANATYTLATVTNAPATAIQTRAATLGGGIAATGGAAAEVFIYYGQSDGGTNAAAWAQRIYLEPQAGTFSQNVTGLAVNSSYYFRATAINPAGVAWAGASQSFSTAAASAPVLTNLPASNVGATGAVISGNVLSTGGDAPVVTLYYGTANGGANSNAWRNSIVFSGVQNGWFGQAISGLTTNTTYFYTAEAVNIAGTVWATPVQSFTTLSANPSAQALVSVLTGRNDNDRTGQNTNETILTPANVTSNTFGRLFSYALDGCMVTQPLVMAGVSIPGNGIHNIVIASTQNDSVYAFDADSNAGANSAPLWHASFVDPAAGVNPVSSTVDLQASSSPGFYGPKVGISGTPVIDPLTGTLYVAAGTREVSGSTTNFVHRLHALDVTTGAEKFGGPVVIEGSIPGFGDGFESVGIVNFVALKHMNRPALLLNNGLVCVTFTSHQDFPPYHGWVFVYNAYTLQLQGVFNTTPNGSAGGIWQGTSGPAGDAQGNIYFESGNGTFDAANSNYGDAVIKLSTAGGLNIVDYFAPYNQLTLNLQDLDIGSAGMILLPDAAGSAAHPHLAVAGSKTGVFWVLDRDNLGQFNAAGDTQVVQEISGQVGGMWVTPAYFNHTLYYCGVGDNVKAFSISNAVVNTSPISKSAAAINYPGSSPSVSASGTKNAIVWAMDTSANQNGPAILHAYNATNLAVELYNSSQNLSRDNPGLALKFTMPTIANGKVYVGTANYLSVFGNLSTLPAPLISPAGGIYTNTVTVSITSPSNGVSIYYTLNGGIPTTNSIFYTGPFVLTNSAAVLAVAALPGLPVGAVASASFFNNSFLGNGTGLVGQYYANSFYTNAFVGSPLVRTDAVINFNWSTTPPAPSIGLTDYTVRWTGMVQPLFTQTYTFSTTTDDGVRLWVNGQELINQWTPQSPTTWSGSINLQALQLYNIEMDYFQAQGGAVAQLFWSSPSTSQAIIPQSQLYPFTNPLALLFASSPSITNGVLALHLSGMPGRTYVLQASTDLANWISVSTNVPSGTMTTLLDVSTTNFPARFYRAVQLQ